MVFRIYLLLTAMLLINSPVFSQKAPAPGELAAAVSIEDMSLIDSLLLRGADPDQPDSRAETALLYAVKSGRNELITKILEAGADPDKPGSDNLTSLMVSVKMSRQDLVVLLLSRDADPNLIVDFTESAAVSALSLALDRGEYDIARILVDGGASPFLIRDSTENSPDPLRLPELKVPLDARIWRDTALLKDSATETGAVDWRKLREELDDGQPVDSRNVRNVTALMSAAWYGNIPAATLLLQRGADPLIKDRYGHDALCYAAAAGKTGILKLLLERIENREEQSREDLSRTALYFAVGNRQHLVLDILLQAGFSPGSDEEGITLLMMASWLGDLYAVEKLLPLSNGGAMDKAGRTALEWSAAAFLRDRRTGREVGNPSRGSKNYPVARLLAGRLRKPWIYSTQPTADMAPEIINAWSPVLNSGGSDSGDDWRDKRPSPVPLVPGDGDLTFYRILRDEEPGIPSY